MLMDIIKGCILMVTIFSITVTGITKPNEFVKNIVVFLEREHEPYAYSQIQLEAIGDSVGLHVLPENERIISEKELMENVDIQKIIKQCKKYHSQPNCNESIYRTYDGTCNSLKNPLWGSSDYMMDRYLSATYEGASGLRKSVKGGDLPNPRIISLNLIDKDNPTRKVSALFTFFGQIIAHDISSSPTFANDEGEMLDCCSPSKKKNSLCKNVYTPKDDPFYSKINISCLPVERTAPYPKCNFEKRNPWNKENSFIDASIVYGYYGSLANNLRAKDGSGKLKSQDTVHGEILPPNKIQDLAFCPMKQTTTCFSAGDERVNQHTMLTTMHLLFLRFHNVIADKLHALNPKWDEEKLYQETRRVVIAAYQNIVYKEYLPWMVTPSLIEKYHLSVDEESLYNEDVNPSALAEFTTASFRPHSMIPKAVSKKNPDIRFYDTYSNPKLIHEGKTESLVSGSCDILSEKNDRYLKTDVDNYLYIPQGADYGLDITVFDVQRGRDHGLPRYVDVVRKCSNGKIDIQDFSDLSRVMPDENIKLLQRIYKHVLDIDLIIGIYMERIEIWIVTGFTAACITAEQFHRSKFGDSFFFTHTNGRYPFTKEQLKSIRSTTLANFICQAGGFSSIRKYAMSSPSIYNLLINCQFVPPFDLTPWEDSSEKGDSSQGKNNPPPPKTKTCYFYIFCF